MNTLSYAFNKATAGLTWSTTLPGVAPGEETKCFETIRTVTINRTANYVIPKDITIFFF
jgi:hypothetical protein